MKQFELVRDGAPDLKFSGERLASVRNSPDRSRGEGWSGSTGRWTKLCLYRTAGGMLVCRRTQYSAWQGERARQDEVVMFDSTASVIKWFGYSDLAKELYQSAKIDASETIE